MTGSWNKRDVRQPIRYWISVQIMGGSMEACDTMYIESTQHVILIINICHI